MALEAPAEGIADAMAAGHEGLAMGGLELERRGDGSRGLPAVETAGEGIGDIQGREGRFGGEIGGDAIAGNRRRGDGRGRDSLRFGGDDIAGNRRRAKENGRRARENRRRARENGRRARGDGRRAGNGRRARGRGGRRTGGGEGLEEAGDCLASPLGEGG